ncbi:MAG: hypothetical protein AVDCRST_MAG02-1205 [uncultured Rubrobacteraceae bacterium]|uniref:Uncharacterized protein n=1 Tax=uncultured Rubrobacteraceae bacterium TaxID=349277 RepID=A0A6J4QS20_9ACTN|nr:MAG: hypothetical protein AVDCRST_MAG02-1205 [uncultured Rubrobacteraceae bacterium]
MTVGTEKNHVLPGVAPARALPVHLQHYRLAKPFVEPTDLANVTTFLD